MLIVMGSEMLKGKHWFSETYNVTKCNDGNLQVTTTLKTIKRLSKDHQLSYVPAERRTTERTVSSESQIETELVNDGASAFYTLGFYG